MSNKPRIMFLLGTRPEAIKLAPVIRAANDAGSFEVTLCLSGQHKHMAIPMLEHFRLETDVTFDVPREAGNLPHLISAVASRVGEMFAQLRPELVIVQGDTTTAMVGAICGFYEQIPVAHVEAGLRSWDFMHPFPEEFNRRVISLSAALHFCPTELSAANLMKEGVPKRRIRIVGNSCIDALMWTLSQSQPADCFSDKMDGILVTGHRRENWDEGIVNLCTAIRQLIDTWEKVEVLFPMHLNPKVRDVVCKILGDTNRVRLTEPLDYRTFCWAMKQAKLIITDSGGVQEEALALGTPTLVTRKVTERPEVLESGTVQLVGNTPATIVRCASRLLGQDKFYKRLNRPSFPFGRGNASLKIIRGLKRYFQV